MVCAHPFLVHLIGPSGRGFHPVSLLGTVHVPVEAPDAYLACVRGAGRVLFEVEEEAEGAPPPSRHGVPWDLLRPALGLGNELGLCPLFLSECSPFLLAMILTTAFLRGDPLDLRLAEEVPPSRREALESLDEMVAVLEGVPLESQLAALSDALHYARKTGEERDALQEAQAEAWRAGTCPEYPDGLGQFLIDEREVAWVPRILDAAAVSDVAVVCGAAHVSGLRRRLGVHGFRPVP